MKSFLLLAIKSNGGLLPEGPEISEYLLINESEFPNPFILISASEPFVYIACRFSKWLLSFPSKTSRWSSRNSVCTHPTCGINQCNYHIFFELWSNNHYRLFDYKNKGICKSIHCHLIDTINLISALVKL